MTARTDQRAGRRRAAPEPGQRWSRSARPVPSAPATLGPQAPRSGLLAAGYDADVITVDADPLADISVLAKPAHVTGVWTAGRQVKGAAAE